MVYGAVVDAVELALDQAGDAVLQGAWPMAVSPTALAKLKEAVRQDFEHNKDRFERDLPEVRRMGWHIGGIATHIANVLRKGEVDADVLLTATHIVNQHCNLTGDLTQTKGRYCGRIRDVKSLK